MLKSIRERTRKFQQQLTQLDNQPLNKAALVVIAFLDVFILISIFDGLASHTRQLTSPDERIPRVCREIVIDGDWNPTNRLDKLARIVARYHGSYVTPDERHEQKPLHTLCAPVVRSVKTIRADAGLAKNLKEHLELRKETNELRAEVERMKGAYDTTLLQGMAKRAVPANVASIEKEIAVKTGSLNELVGKQRLLQTALEQDSRVRTLFTLVVGVSDADRKALRDELRRLNFWYPVKRLGMELMFLLPLFLVFYFWNTKSIAAHRPYQTLVSSHLLVVVLIPVFFKLVELVYDIIPKKLLKQLIDLLETLNLVAIWHYLLMALAILLALALTYLFQKKLFSHEKLMQRRIAKGQCQKCGLHLPSGSQYCPACGAGQFRACARCNEPTPVNGKYCTACGHEAK